MTSAPCPRLEGQKESKLLRGVSDLVKRKRPPKNCMPRRAHMYINMTQTMARDHRDPRATASVLRIFLMSFQLLASLKSRNRRAPLSAENVPLLELPSDAKRPAKISTSEAPTTTKSNWLNLSAKYSLKPSPIHLHTISTMKTVVRTLLMSSRTTLCAGSKVLHSDRSSPHRCLRLIVLVPAPPTLAFCAKLEAVYRGILHRPRVDRIGSW
mmetsp:Transcript_8883/g.23197  ORF Transcript_8883/g.23197 Transcript_8883/m.23197 type:complete len:211 (+) Transcript_8883:1129-1761(+)